MSVGDWLTDSQNWVFVVLSFGMLFTGWRVVTSKNVVHAVLYLVVTLAISAGFFLLLGAEFVAWVVVLISIGAVVVLFLFGIMITKAPMGQEVDLSHPNSVKIPAAIVSFVLFVFVGGAVLAAFPDTAFPDPSVTRAADIGDSMFQRWVIPFEVVSILLLAALIGGIVLARRDDSEIEAAAAAEEDAAAETGSGHAPEADEAEAEEAVALEAPKAAAEKADAAAAAEDAAATEAATS